MLMLMLMLMKSRVFFGVLRSVRSSVVGVVVIVVWSTFYDNDALKTFFGKKKKEKKNASLSSSLSSLSSSLVF